jgi:DNA-binding transcriptional MerR regulator
MSQTMSLKDAAALLGVKAYKIEYRLAHGLVAEPTMRVAGRRVFTSEDVQRLAKHFGKTMPSAETAAEPAAEVVGV